MSYLLTEIALEMLGFTFFDINGDAQDTNFQTSGPIYNNRKRRPDADETNLEKLLMIPSEIEMENTDNQFLRTILMENQKEKSPIKIKENSTENMNEIVNKETDTLADSIAEAETETETTADDDAEMISEITTITETVNAAKPEMNSDLNKSNLNKSTLSKLLSFEQRRIIYQVMLNRKNFVREALEASKITDKNEVSASNFMKPFISSETQKLKAEVENMTKFRQTVEQILSKSSSKNFEKYLRTFNRSMLPKDNR